MKLRILTSSVRTLPKQALRTAPTVESWRDGKTTAERGYGGRWQRAREFFLQRNPLCVFCARNGYVETATVVDHIVPHKGDQKLFWDRSNWQSLCKHCHDSTKRQIENDKTARHRVGTDGWPEHLSHQQGPAFEITAHYLMERGLDAGDNAVVRSTNSLTVPPGLFHCYPTTLVRARRSGGNVPVFRGFCLLTTPRSHARNESPFQRKSNGRS